MSPWRFQATIISNEKEELTEQKFDQICGETFKILFKGAHHEKLKGEGVVFGAGRMGALVKIKRLTKQSISISGVLTTPINILKFCQSLHIPADRLDVKHVK